MKQGRWLMLALVASFILCAMGAGASEKADGYIPSSGVHPGAVIVGGWTGTAVKGFVTDPTGVLRVTEEYPPQLQANWVPGASLSNPVTVLTGLQQIGNSWSAAIWAGATCIRLQNTSTVASDKLRIYLFGSVDNVTFQPISTSAAWGGTADTMKTIWAPTASGQSIRIPIDPVKMPYGGPYMALYVARDSANGSTEKLGFNIEGRWK